MGKSGCGYSKKLVYELKRTRGIKPNESNWLLFASMVEAALLEFTGEYDTQRLYYGVNRFIDEWYKGDAWYGDGAELHLDYYNSLVIHPMLTDVLSVMKSMDWNVPSSWNANWFVNNEWLPSLNG